MGALKPRLQALVLADQVYVDAGSGKRIVAGIFDKLGSKDFPTVLGRPTYAYISLTNIRGKVELAIKYRDMQDFKVLMETEAAELECPDPLATAQLAIVIPTFPMPHPGVYSFELHLNGEEIGAVRMTVVQV